MNIKKKLTESKNALHRTFKDATLRFKGKAELDDALTDAVIFGRLEDARKLMSRGADPNADNSFAICLAVSKQDMPMLLALLETGKAGCSSEAPLRIAVTEGRVAMAYKLIEKGADFGRAQRFAREKGNKYEIAHFDAFLERYSLGLARVEKRVVGQTPKDVSGPKS